MIQLEELHTHRFKDTELHGDYVEIQATADDIFLTVFDSMSDKGNAYTVSVSPTDAVVLGELLSRYGTDAI